MVEWKNFLNEIALIFVGLFALVVLSIFGAIYSGASNSYSRGELGLEGIRILRWALVGFAGIYALLALSAFLA
jgi:uncharacterized membrane protein YuzA (DUF378 family)